MDLKCIVSLETFQYGKQNQFINFDVLVYFINIACFPPLKYTVKKIIATFILYFFLTNSFSPNSR